MMILQAFGVRQSFRPVSRLQTQVFAFVLTRLTAFNCGDLRWTVAAMALRLAGSALGLAERQLARWARAVLRRAWQGARFTAEREAADSMVAAGGR